MDFDTVMEIIPKGRSVRRPLWPETRAMFVSDVQPHGYGSIPGIYAGINVAFSDDGDYTLTKDDFNAEDWCFAQTG